MKITRRYNEKFEADFDGFFKECSPMNIPKKSSSIQYDAYEEYLNQVAELKKIISCEELITDEFDKPLTALEIYNVIEDRKIRIRKLLLIIDLKLYKTININKPTNIRYIVYRANWIDKEGKPIRRFSKNLGAESKTLVNNKIPVFLLNDIEEEILIKMWDLYNIQYKGFDDTGIDENGDLYIL